MTTVNSKYTLEVTWSKIKDHASDTNFRILKITDYCCNVNTEKSFEAESVSLKELLVESSNLFFLIIETTDKHFDNTIIERVIYDTLRNSGKYFLIEICHGIKKCVRYIFNGVTSQQLLNEKLTDFFESVDDSLIQSRLNSSAFNNLKNVSSKNVSQPLDIILIRLVKAFDIVCPENVEKTILKNLVLNSNVDAFRAFLDLPVIDDGESIKHTVHTTKAVDYKYDYDATLLFFAANRETNMLKLLLRLGADVYAQNYHSKTASDYTSGNYTNLKILLEYDAKFPRNFHQTYTTSNDNHCNDNIPEEFREMCLERQLLHQAIVDGNAKMIDSFEKKFPLLKFAYDFIDEEPYSRAATTTALKEAVHNEKDDFGVYLYLNDKGFCVDECELHFMTTADKNKVTAIKLNQIKTEQPSYITFLRGKTFIYGVDDFEKQLAFKVRIKEIYRKLNGISDLVNILKMVEHSKSLTVSVDFRNKSVIHSDLTSSNKMDGLTYYNLGRIYLSVADKGDKEIGGLLIHELTHFALHIIFKNNGKPYHTFDTVKEASFNEIVEKIRVFRKDLPIDHDVADVVNKVYTAYSKSDRPKELIARVPQLIALGVHCENYETMAELFKFYRKNVLPYMEKLASSPEDFFIKREVRQLNEFLRHVEEIEKWNIHIDKTCLNDGMCDERGVRKVICDIPRLFLTDFYNEAVKKSLMCTPSSSDEQQAKHVIFASIKDFVNSYSSTYIQQVWNLTSNITLTIDVDEFVNLNSQLRTKFVEMLKRRDTSKNIVAFGRNQIALNSIFDANHHCIILKYTWKHLETKYRKALLSKEINFQGALVPLNKFIDDDFHSIPMAKLVNDEEIIITMTVEDDYDDDTFVERSFSIDGEVCTTADVLSLTTKHTRGVLLSGFPGSGQSTIISRIAVTLKDLNHKPNFWVAIVNLEQFTSAAKDTATTDVDLLIRKHFLNTTSDFELSLFKKLYDNSEVIFLFDCFVDVPYDCIERAVSLLKILSEKNQLWITVHTDSPSKAKLAKILSNKIDVKLVPFSNHLACVTKIWQKHINLFDADDASKLNLCAEKVLKYYKDFIGLPKLTSIIASRYLKSVKEYIRNSDDPFMPENIYTRSDIYDFHEDLYKEKIQRRDTKETVFLGMNMFTAFDQFGDFCMETYERNDSTQKPLMMYATGGNDLLRNGIINYEFEISRIGSGSHFFLSNYIVQSLASSYKVNGNLCKTIINRADKLIAFIEGRMKSSILFNIDYTKSSFTQQYNKQYTRLGWDDVLYLLNQNAIFISCFILNTLDRPDAPRRVECFTECSIFSIASEKCLRCIIEILWKISNEKFIEHLTKVDAQGCSPFQYAFMNFPQNDIDVVRDITKVFGLSDALRTQEIFNRKLNKSPDKKYSKSTLGFYVEIILKKSTDEERSGLIYEYSTRLAAISELKISGKHFDEIIERKWTVMEHLNFPTTDWMELTTNTLFRNVVHTIFNELNNNIVMRFYKWAEKKVENVETFNTFVADTFVKFFWNCTSDKHGKEIIAFVRDRIDVEEALEQRGIEVLNQMFDDKRDLPGKFYEKIAIYRSLLTEKEFKMLLFLKVGNDHENLMFKICRSCDEETIYPTFAIVPLTEIMEKTTVDWGLLKALIVYMVGRLDDFQHELTIKCVIDFIHKQKRELISDALCICTMEGSLFNLAFVRRDMFMVQLLWQITARYLNEEEFQAQLLDKNETFPKLVENVTANEFLRQPPSIHNTNCQTACFEFLPFEPNGGAAIPKFAVSLNDTQQIYIGRCKVLNQDGYVLCKIIPNTSEPVELIEFTGIEKLEDSLQIMIGKGLKWTKHTDDVNEQLYFRFKENLLKRQNEHVTLVDRSCVGEYYLAYDDAAAASSEMVTGFCYRQGVRWD